MPSYFSRSPIEWKSLHQPQNYALIKYPSRKIIHKKCESLYNVFKKIRLSDNECGNKSDTLIAGVTFF